MKRVKPEPVVGVYLSPYDDREAALALRFEAFCRYAVRRWNIEFYTPISGRTVIARVNGKHRHSHVIFLPFHGYIGAAVCDREKMLRKGVGGWRDAVERTVKKVSETKKK